MNKEAAIAKQMDRILNAEEKGSYEDIRRYLSEKRRTWFEKNKHLLDEMKDSDLRKAYELTMLKYIGIDPKEVPVVYEDDKKIIWHSYNWCSVLEACKRLNIDTRKVCKEGWEEWVDEMAKMINSRLHFSRTYKTLRPHGEYCEEMFELRD